MPKRRLHHLILLLTLIFGSVAPAWAGTGIQEAGRLTWGNSRSSLHLFVSKSFKQVGVVEIDGSVWVAPMEDIKNIANRAGVVTGTGHAPGPLWSYLKGEKMYGIAVPTETLNLRLPMITDSGANKHFRLGGYTGVEHNGVWRSSNVREFILPGGEPVPKGSVFFEFNNNGSWTVIRRF